MDLLKPVLDPAQPLSFYGLGVLHAIEPADLPSFVSWGLQSRASYQGALTGATLLEGSPLPKEVDASLQLELHNLLAARLLSRLPALLSQFSVLSPVQWEERTPTEEPHEAGIETQYFRLDPLDHRLNGALYFRLRIHLQTGETGNA